MQWELSAYLWLGWISEGLRAEGPQTFLKGDLPSHAHTCLLGMPLHFKPVCFWSLEPCRKCIPLSATQWSRNTQNTILSQSPNPISATKKRHIKFSISKSGVFSVQLDVIQLCKIIELFPCLLEIEKFLQDIYREIGWYSEWDDFLLDWSRPETGWLETHHNNHYKIKLTLIV